MALEFARYDQRNYPMADPRAGYAEWAATYDAQVGAELDEDLLARVDSVRWAGCATAADLACGTGRTGAWLRARGVATIDGVDLTREMLEHAHAKSIYRSLSLGDVRASGLRGHRYDLVTNVLCCEHLPRLEPLYDEAARLLRRSDEARVVVIGFHPHFMLNGIPTHFRKRDGCHQAIDVHIHLLGDHCAAARAAQLTLLELHERVVDDAWVARAPNYRRHAGRPVSYAFVWRRC